VEVPPAVFLRDCFGILKENDKNFPGNLIDIHVWVIGLQDQAVVVPTLNEVQRYIECCSSFYAL
jgi:hypothetical protein